MSKKWILSAALLCLLSALTGFSLGFRSAPLEAAAETLPETLVTEPETVPETTVAETEPLRQAIDTVPQYYQTDYPYLKFGSSGGTIATSGCSLTSLAMVATYMTDRVYTPDQLVYHFDKEGLNNVEKLELAAEALHLPYEKNFDFSLTRKALEAGKVVIVLENEKSDFTTGQHFLVLTGINDAGLVTVNDPNKNNYEKWNLKAGFADGFREGILIGGYSGSWIYDPSQISDDPFLYIDPSAEEVECRYPDLSLSDADVELLAKLVCAEADGEPFEGQQAVAEVILNRVAASNFPGTVTGVIKAPDQFRAASQLYRAKPTHVQYEAVRRAWKGPYVLDKDVVFFSTGAVNKNVWGTIGNHTFCHQYT